MKVAVIGLGQMGGGIADNLVRAGHEVRVFDVARAAMEPRVALGATAATSPADAALGAELVSIVVFDDQQVLESCLGDEGVLSTLAPGAVIAIHTTATISAIRTVAEAAAARGVHVIDAGISGGESGATAGTLLVMVGGSDDAVGLARPAIEAFAKELVHAGDLGTGMALKLARNAVGYAWMSAVHEAMDFSSRAGVDPRLLRHAIVEADVLGQALTPLGMGGPEPYPADSPEATMFEHVARLADKDLEHALLLAADMGTAAPVLEVTRAEFRSAIRLGPLVD